MKSDGTNEATNFDHITDVDALLFEAVYLYIVVPEGLPGGGGGPCSLVPFDILPMFPCSPKPLGGPRSWSIHSWTGKKIPFEGTRNFKHL